MAESDETGTGTGPAPHRIGGRYEIGEMLGRGGMAEVRKGTDVRLGRTVAVKRLRTDLASDQTFQARFRREAQSAASLNHPAIVSVYDTGEEVIEEGGHVVAQPYIVMEYVAGRTLRDILREGRKVLPERALEITSQVLAALDYSHRAGIVHRDIKPANVMLTPAGDVKVMDFGIARAVSDASSTMTQTAAVVGTAQYLSPEQARGETVDSRSDVYSTGCLLYELLTGRPPFVGDSPVAVAYQHVREVAPSPSALDEDLTPQIDAIVMKALAKSTATRYQSAAEMKADIDRYLAGKPVTAPPVVSAPVDQATQVMAGAAAPTSVVPAVSGTGTHRTYDEPRKSRVWPMLLLGLLLAGLVVLAAIYGPRLLDDSAQQVEVPQVTQLTQQQAEAKIRAAGLVVGQVDTENSEEVRKGLVISQDPGGRQMIDEGSEVDLVVSAGREQRVVPYVLDDDKDSAGDQLRALGLKPRFVEVDSDEDKDAVVATRPEAGTSVPYGSVVTVEVSRGPVEVPNVVGKSKDEATRILRDAGFEVDVREEDDTTRPKGEVVDQTPEQGATPGEGSTVTIFVSTYEPEPTPTPTPTPTDSPSPTLTLP